MRSKLISLKKALFGGMAFVMAATLVAPASPVLAAEIETQTEASESGAQAQTDIGKSTADTRVFDTPNSGKALTALFF